MSAILEDGDWLLITVTGSGQVNTSRHETEEEAKIVGSLARYGYTPQELHEIERKQDEERQREIEEYKAKNPPRPPTKQEKEHIEKHGGLPWCSWSNGHTQGTTELTPDGMVQEIRYSARGGMSPRFRSSDGEWCDWVAGGAVIRNKHSVKEVRIIYSPRVTLKAAE